MNKNRRVPPRAYTPTHLQKPDASKAVDSGGEGLTNNDSSGTSIVKWATGPRSLLGKTRSKLNSLKHGIFSSVVVLEDESKADFDSLLSGLRDDFQPVGALEKLLVEKLAMLVWRQRRLLAAEGAEILSARVFLEWDRSCKQKAEGEKQANMKAEGDSFYGDSSDYKEALVRHIENPEILNACLELLGTLREKVAHEGLSEDSQETILKRLYGPPFEAHLRETLLQVYSQWSHTAKADDDEREENGYATPEECKKQVLLAIDSEIKRLTQFKVNSSEIEAKRIELEGLRQCVPDSPGLERLIRYETSLERQFDRTLTQLERIQRMRAGQLIPPPIKVDVSS